MYAIALIAGKQYKVSVGDVVRVDRLNNEVGTQNVKVVINVLNTNYELEINTITSTVNINDHEANLDDNDCSTEVTCKHCDYIVIEAKEHTHSSVLLFDETHHYYECDDCKKHLEKVVHSFTILTKVDETSHKEVCLCGKEIISTHTYGDWVVNKNPSETEKGSKIKTCSCGHAIIEDIPAINSTNLNKEPVKSLPIGATIGIVAGSITLLGLIVFVIFWFVVKKRNFADLIRLFKK